MYFIVSLKLQSELDVNLTEHSRPEIQKNGAIQYMKRINVSGLNLCLLCLFFSNGASSARSNASCTANLGKLKGADEWKNQADAMERYVRHCCEMETVIKENID